MPNSLTFIGEEAFKECYKITSIEIPSSLVEIYGDAFHECENLKSVYSYATTPPTINHYGYDSRRDDYYYCGPAFDEEHYIQTTLYVPKGCKEDYQKAEEWKEFKNIVEFDATGVEQKQAVKSTTTRRYSINGNKLDAPQKGINIIHMNDGSVKKVIVK